MKYSLRYTLTHFGGGLAVIKALQIRLVPCLSCVINETDRELETLVDERRLLAEDGGVF